MIVAHGVWLGCRASPGLAGLTLRPVTLPSQEGIVGAIRRVQRFRASTTRVRLLMTLGGRVGEG